jgi:tight adherence protein C
MTMAAVLAVVLGAAAATLTVQHYLALRESRLRQRQRIERLQDGDAKPEVGGSCGRAASSPLIAGYRARVEVRERKAAYEEELPRMLDMVALGMRAGQGFDQAFALYVRRFETPLADACRRHFDAWECGLIGREEGLRLIAEEVGSPFFNRFCAAAVRATRFGAPLTELLQDLALEARRELRSSRKEQIAKAPVKMLVPTTALILPAMLILVMGPIGLDLMERI